METQQPSMACHKDGGRKAQRRDRSYKRCCALKNKPKRMGWQMGSRQMSGNSKICIAVETFRDISHQSFFVPGSSTPMGLLIFRGLIPCVCVAYSVFPVLHPSRSQLLSRVQACPIAGVHLPMLDGLAPRRSYTSHGVHCSGHLSVMPQTGAERSLRSY
ncbi:hypothetical protein BV22DRAFT_618959 [Leucogyrophana mollusca]|uniref:Uncharacterized protein n=1 Tax=Leucogyrophana mollusca TaxID=85980 RepID=A0ACB8BBA7_9AGAM|nr:hypothetical protein BV22DRAFT_618959 [Leucogyrophana mollusca]